MLHIHRAERADSLVDALRELLAEPLPDPFAAEVVAVPTRGMERWLTQRMSARLGATGGRSDGVCANVGFPSPRRLVGDALAAASGIAPDEDPWLPERAVWPLLDVVEGCLDEPWLGVLAAHLGDGADEVRRARRFATVRHIAELYDRYAVQRPEMVRGWAQGARHGGPSDPPGAAWQAELWRRLRARIAVASPAERTADACARLRAEPDLVELPARVSLFGLTRLPAAQLDVLRALADARDVHLFVLHPSPALWARVAQAVDAPVVRRADDPTARLPRNRLLASWGQDARELQLVIDGDGAVDRHHPVDHATGTLLARLQAGARDDDPPPGRPLPGEEALDARPLLAQEDRSVQVHACHGRARQVEVLRDAILHLLEEDDELEPRDVIVMCPDIETFAPLIHATFGAGELPDDDEDDDLDPVPRGRRPPDLRVRLADRSLRQTNPVLGVIAQLLDLADQRLTASQVLDLADREPVRRRFRLDDDDLARVEDWVAAAGIRWGLDAEHRRPFKLDALAAGTWRAGLDRVLVGVTMTEDDDRLFGGVLPLDDVESRAIDLAGRFAELVDRLQDACDRLTGPRTIDAWAGALGDAADALCATSQRDAWQRSELQRILDDLVREATTAGGLAPTELAAPEVRVLLADRLQGRPTRANFRTGHLTICTLMPMRSVPHRVVCLLGLDDAVFPRKAPRDGDDLILDDQHVGDRDARSEDRQLLLDALMAAGDRLIVTYTGNDERTNAERPPAVPIGELLDTIDATVRVEGDGLARDRVITRHPLQGFDPRNFDVDGDLAPGGPWSFDRVTLDGARALTGRRRPLDPFLAEPLPPLPTGRVELEDLVRFVEHPAKAFLRQRLDVRLSRFNGEIADTLPIELTGLDDHRIGERLLASRLGGNALSAALAAEASRGELPPGRLADPVVQRVGPLVEQIAGHAEALVGAGAEPASVDVPASLRGGRSISGTVPEVCGNVLRRVTYSKLNARHRIALWVRFLALTAAHPETAYEAVAVGRARAGAAKGTSVSVARLRPPAADAATRASFAAEHLTTLLDLFDAGMREPLPIACKASGAYAEATHQGRDAERAGRDEWESGWAFDKEDKDLEHQLVLGGVRTFAELLAEPPRTGESGEGWHDEDPTRFGRYARRLWTGLLICEEVEDR